MRDATEISKVQFEYNGVDVERTQTYVTCNGEVYIGLYHKGSWVNVRGVDLHRYIKKNKEQDGKSLELPRLSK